MTYVSTKIIGNCWCLFVFFFFCFFLSPCPIYHKVWHLRLLVAADSSSWGWHCKASPLLSSPLQHPTNRLCSVSGLDRFPCSFSFKASKAKHMGNTHSNSLPNNSKFRFDCWSRVWWCKAPAYTMWTDDFYSPRLESTLSRRLSRRAFISSSLCPFLSVSPNSVCPYQSEPFSICVLISSGCLLSSYRFFFLTFFFNAFSEPPWSRWQAAGQELREWNDLKSVVILIPP